MCRLSDLPLFLLLLSLTSVCLSDAQEENDQGDGNVVKNFRNFDIWWDCLEASLGMYLSEEPALVIRRSEGRQLRNDMKAQTPNKIDTEVGRGKNKKSKKQGYLLLATAVIAAKAAAIATAASIMIPLALKGITLLAAKSLLVGKMAVLLVSLVGFMRMIQPAPMTEVILEDAKHKRMDLSVGGRPLRKGPHGFTVL